MTIDIIKSCVDENKHSLREFQLETARTIVEKFEIADTRKLLIADEVGLGKTYVAIGVIQMMEKIKKSKDCNHELSVIYMSPNEAISTQNFNKITKELIDKSQQTKLSSKEISDQRLSMLFHHSNNSPIHLYPISPGVTIGNHSAFGTKEERALFCAAISIGFEHHESYKNCILPIKSLLFEPATRYTITRDKWFTENYPKRWDDWCHLVEEKIQEIRSNKSPEALMDFIEKIHFYLKDKAEFKQLNDNLHILNQWLPKSLEKWKELKWIPENNDSESEIVDLIKSRLCTETNWNADDINMAHLLVEQMAKQSETATRDALLSIVNICFATVITLPFVSGHIWKWDNSIDLEIRNKLAEYENNTYEKWSYVFFTAFRKLFSFISIDDINPDLIILDEFHRYEKDLMELDVLLSSGDTRVLLLSATPYKMPLDLIAGEEETDEYYSSTNNKDNKKEDSVFQGLVDVIEYLEQGQDHSAVLRVTEQFDDLREGFSNLAQLSIHEGVHQAEEWKGQWDTLAATRDALNQEMSASIMRTERYMAYDIYSDGDMLHVSEDFSNIGAGCIREEALVFKGANNMRNQDKVLLYSKAAPFFLSFANNYASLGSEAQIGESNQRLKMHNTLLLDQFDEDNISKHKHLLFWDGRRCDPLHLRTKALILESMPDGIHKLAWLPPTLPYYRLEGCFEGHQDYTKTLVFASHVMSTKAIGAILSQRARELCDEHGRLEDHVFQYMHLENDETIMKLANLYSPCIHKRRQTLECIIKEVVEKVQDVHLPPDMDRELAALLSIASPTVCAYRSVKDVAAAKAIGEAFANYLKSDDISRALSAAGVTDGKALLNYCAYGCIQAVIDEYIFMLNPKDSFVSDEDVKTITLSLAASPSKIKYFSEHAYDKRINNKVTIDEYDFVWCGFAERFTDDQSDSGDSKAEHLERLRIAFNSPFRPFVMATTPMAQEGLDFHWYCHKMMHWRLPVSPMDMEQREGRINRYRGHVVRKRAVQQYSNENNVCGISMWNKIFDSLKKRNDGLTDEKRGMYPDWYINSENKDSPKLIRVVANHPYSKEEFRYAQLIDSLGLYRLSLGYGVNIEKLQAIRARAAKSKEDVKRLLLNLSPAFQSEYP